MMFLNLSRPIFNFLVTFIFSSANAFILDQPKIFSFGIELNEEKYLQFFTAVAFYTLF